MKQPLFIILSLQGSQGMSDPFKLDAPATTLFWCRETQILYLGHESGAVSAYKITAQQKKHKIMQALEQETEQVPQTAMERLNRVISNRKAEMREKGKLDLKKQQAE